MDENSFFDNLNRLKENSPEFQQKSIQSLDWYRKKVQELYGDRILPPGMVFGESKERPLPRPGDIMLFNYRPQMRKELPFYDVYPLVLIIKLIPQGFLGLNFHYLHPRDRMKFMVQLYKYERYATKRDDVMLNVKYTTLLNDQKLFYYTPCIRKYKSRNVGNLVYKIPAHEWEPVLFLPTEKFVKEKKQDVWAESSKKLRGKNVKY